MKTILITAYAVNPFNGSEDGTGWNISLELARHNKVIVITRKNNRPHIEKYLQEQPNELYENMSFEYYDLPKWAMFWKKRIGERGYVLYFYLWQLFMPWFIKRKNLKFDISHSLNFHSDSQPHFLWVFKQPSFWGPIGHHPPIPKEFIKDIYGKKAYRKDRLYNAVKWCMRNLDPFFHLCTWRTKKIFVINSSVPSVIGCKEEKAVTLPAVATKCSGITLQKKKTFTVLSVGRFVFMKGFDVTIRSFAKFFHYLSEEDQKKCQLVLVGKGEELPLMKKIAKENNIYHAIKWVDWVEKSAMDKIYEDADLFLFPSHEGAGMVVVEAMSKGLPVICFDNPGPGELIGEAGFRIEYGEYQKTVDSFCETLDWLFSYPDLMEDLSHNATQRAKELFNWENKATIITNQYNQVLFGKDVANTNEYPQTIS